MDSASKCDTLKLEYHYEFTLADVPEGILPARRRPHVPGKVQAGPARLRAGVQGAAQRQGLQGKVHRVQEDRAGNQSSLSKTLSFNIDVLEVEPNE